MLPYLLHTTAPADYPRYLEEKVAHVRAAFQTAGISLPEPAIHASAPEHFRMRIEFDINHGEDERLRYVMFRPHSRPRERIFIGEFPGASQAICDLMPALATALPRHHELAWKLFALEFLSTTSGEILTTLIYHRPVREALWQEEARALSAELAALNPHLHFTARSRNQHVIATTDRIVESYALGDRMLRLTQIEGTFTQPNAGICTQMLNFAISCCPGQDARDLLELYCGSGTFTLALAPGFRRVLATEVSRVPLENARANVALNGLANVALVRLSAAETEQALAGTREFRRLQECGIDLKSFDFSTVLVDPPRQGIGDAAALSFLTRFPRIIYVSCGFDSLIRDLGPLLQSHALTRIGFFDQFPYTPHIETMVLLTRRS